jgi:hypothetical protein
LVPQDVHPPSVPISRRWPQWPRPTGVRRRRAAPLVPPCRSARARSRRVRWPARAQEMSADAATGATMTRSGQI